MISKPARKTGACTLTAMTLLVLGCILTVQAYIPAASTCPPFFGVRTAYAAKYTYAKGTFKYTYLVDGEFGEGVYIKAVNGTVTPRIPKKISGKKVVSVDLHGKRKIKRVNTSKAVYLRGLNLERTSLTEIDIKANRKLIKLNVSETGIKRLSIRKNRELTVLKARGCKMSKLDVSRNAALRRLDVSNVAKLKELHIKGNAKLRRLNVSKTGLTRLDITKCPNLGVLNTSGSRIKSIDIKNSPRLARVNVSDSPFREFKGGVFRSALIKLNARNTRLGTVNKTLGLARATSLQYLNLRRTSVKKVRLPRAIEDTLVSRLPSGTKVVYYPRLTGAEGFSTMSTAVGCTYYYDYTRVNYVGVAVPMRQLVNEETWLTGNDAYKRSHFFRGEKIRIQVVGGKAANITVCDVGNFGPLGKYPTINIYGTIYSRMFDLLPKAMAALGVSDNCVVTWAYPI